MRAGVKLAIVWVLVFAGAAYAVKTTEPASSFANPGDVLHEGPMNASYVGATDAEVCGGTGGFAHRVGATIVYMAQLAPATGNDLEKVLSQMDAVAASFTTTEADFVWDQYTKVVNETDTQSGKVYFRKVGKGTEMAAYISQPARKYVLYQNGEVRVYEPRIDQVTVYKAGKNRAEVESFLVLGFGGRGHDLLKSFDVSFQGYEDAGGVRTAKLDLVPKTAKVKSMFDHIILWIDTTRDATRGVSVQQQFTEPQGDYRLAKYSNIKPNQNIPDDVFKLKTTGRTKVINPQGSF